MYFLPKDLDWPPCHNPCVALRLKACLEQARIAPSAQQPRRCVLASPRLCAGLAQDLWVGWATGVGRHVSRPCKVLYCGRPCLECRELRLQAVCLPAHPIHHLAGGLGASVRGAGALLRHGSLSRRGRRQKKSLRENVVAHIDMVCKSLTCQGDRLTC